MFKSNKIQGYIIETAKMLQIIIMRVITWL